PAPASRAAGSAACVPPGRAVSRLQVPLSTAQTLTARPGELPYGILVRYRVPFRTTVPVIYDGGGQGTLDTGVDHLWAPSLGGELAPIPTPQPIDLDQVWFELPAGSCITELAVGVFHVSGPPT